MGSRLQRRMALRRKLLILRTLTKSKSVKKSGIIKDAFLYINKLKLQVEAIKREYQYLVNHIQEEQVKVEKVVNDGRRGLLMVRVGWKMMSSSSSSRSRSSKGEEVLMSSMLEGFERMNVNVVEASCWVTSNHFFRMEAIVDASAAAFVDDAVPFLNQAILNHLLQTQTQTY